MSQPPREPHAGDASDEVGPESPESEEAGRRHVGILETLRKAIGQGAGALTDEKLRETLVSEILRKAISISGDVYDSTEDGVRKLLGELPLPKDVADRVATRLDDYKGELFRMVKQEVHDFLDKVDLGYELQKLLTSLSFEVTTEIRFVPNEKSAGSAGPNVKPDVKTNVKVNRVEKRRRRRGPASGGA